MHWDEEEKTGGCVPPRADGDGGDQQVLAKCLAEEWGNGERGKSGFLGWRRAGGGKSRRMIFFFSPPGSEIVYCKMSEVK